MNELSVCEGVDVLMEGERVAKIGPRLDPRSVAQTVDARGGVVIPGLVDPHTHAVFAGTREDEFLARLQGLPYDGGGILATAQAWPERAKRTSSRRAGATSARCWPAARPRPR